MCGFPFHAPLFIAQWGAFCGSLLACRVSRSTFFEFLPSPADTVGMNIVLIGYRGSGKTSIGKRLSSDLWMDFVDTDALIVERAGTAIREIFEAEGEEGFRRRESEVIAEVAARDNYVIAAGGGAILKAENVAALKKNGKLVWLKAKPEVLFQHIQADAATDANRPNLTSAGGLEEVQKVLETRTPLYQAAADVTFEVTYLTIEDAAKRLAGVI
jgi:shikimate kinase